MADICRLTKAMLLPFYLYEGRFWQRAQRYFEAIAINRPLKITINGSVLLIDYLFCKSRNTTQKEDMTLLSDSLSITYKRKKCGPMSPLPQNPKCGPDDF